VGSARPPGPFAVIATGRLGGREMSYTTDVDLLYVYDALAAGGDVPADAREFFVRLGCDLTAALGDETPDGLLYRVALPAWPQTDRGLKACSLNEYAEHYSASADVGERLALTRARPVAGDTELGARFIAVCQRSLYGEDDREAGLPSPALSDRDRGADPWTVESLTQVLQLRHGARHAALRHAGTLDAIDALRHAGLIGEDLCRELDHAHVFLESAEHRRQLGVPEDLQKQVDASRERVRELCTSIRRLAGW